MKSLKNRILSGTMAGVLALSLAVPAFATENAADPNTTEITGSYQATNIDVVVPTTGLAFINPYALDIEVPKDGKTPITDATAAADKVTISEQQIVTAPMAIKNRTAMDLNVAATVSGAVKEGSLMRFATASAASATSKSAYVYLQAKQEATLTGADSAVDAAAIATKYAAWGKSAYNAETDVVVGDREATQEHLVNLKAATMSSGVFSAYAAGSVALVRLTGDCPSNLRDPWTDADGFTVKVAYTFSPAEKYAITADAANFTATGAASVPTAISVSPTTASAGTTVTVTLTLAAAADKPTVTATGADNTSIEVTPGTKTGNTALFTFVMPAQAVTIGGSVAE